MSSPFEPAGATADPLAAIDEAAGLTRVAGGDPETITLMRLGMRMFTRQAGVSPRLRQLVEDMLEGRSTIDVVMRDPEFDSIISTRLDTVAAAVEQLPEDERPSMEWFAARSAAGDEPTTDRQLSALMRRADPRAARLADRDEAELRGEDDDMSGWLRPRH
jgi:hypothetical protein